MSKYDQCEHRLPCGTCIKTGKICPHLEKRTEPYRVTPLVIEPIKEQVLNIPDCCVNCSNHPSNGGSGICNCVLPYMSGTSILQNSSYSIVNNGDGTYSTVTSLGKDTQYKDSQTEYNPAIPHTYTDSNGIHT